MNNYRVNYTPVFKKMFLVMRLSFFLLLFSIMQTFALNGYTQSSKISLSVKDVKLENILLQIENESHYRFAYNKNEVNVDKTYSVKVKNANIENVLNQLFGKQQNVSYTIINGRQIVLSSSSKNSVIIQQQNKVTGKITDSSGASLPGVTIVIKGTTNGTITDNEGNYSLFGVPYDATLLFSFVGMKSQEITVAGKTTVNVKLTEESIGIDEVVAIGYGVQKKVNAIGSITTVNTDEIVASPVSMVSNAIAGRMPGVVVRQMNGEPGQAASILIRGQATLGNASPLVVIDGIQGRDMNSINSSDIESISVLKDASAAIYGARSANGVILITTKRGSSGAPTFRYGFNQGIMSLTKTPKMCDAGTYAQMLREMEGYKNINESNMIYSADDVEKFKSGDYPWTHPNTDWFDVCLNHYSTRYSHDFSVDGGNDKITYYGSFGSQSEGGINKNSAFSYARYNIKTQFDAKINKFLKVGVDINGSQENKHEPTRGSRNVWTAIKRGKPTEVAVFPNGLPGPDIEYGDNPVVIATDTPGSNKEKIYRINSKFSAMFKVPGVEGLTIDSYFAYDKYFNVAKLFQKPFSLYSMDTQSYLNDGNTGSEDGSAYIMENFPKGPVSEPTLEDSYNDAETKTFNVKINYDKTFGGVHNLSAFISMESMEYFSKGISAYRRYFISDKLPYLFAGGVDSWTNNGSASLDSRLNYFGRVMYNYKETYLLQFTLRKDGSLRFSEDNGRWGTFPSVLAGWRISNENFWKENVKFIDYFKIKASYGQMGNDAVDAFQYLRSYIYDTGMVFGSNSYSTGLAQSGSPNPFITWEVAKIANVGFESTLLDSKINFDFDVFYQRRSDILVKRNASVPSYTGITLPDENFGIVDNKGFELELGYSDKISDFSYSINGNAAFARNKIVEFDEPERNEPWQELTGHPRGSFLLYRSAGIYKDEAQVNSTAHVPGARPGDIIIEDYDGNGTIDSNDKTIFDNPNIPELTYGISFSLGYKNWSLDGLIQGASKTLVNMLGDNRTGTGGNYYEFESIDRWTVDNTDASRPRAYDMSIPYWREQFPTDYNYQKNGYMRLKNLNLSYTIPNQLLKKFMVKDAVLYIAGQNLLIIYSQNKILDPENTDMTGYPIMRTYSVGVKIAL